MAARTPTSKLHVDRRGRGFRVAQRLPPPVRREFPALACAGPAAAAAGALLFAM